MPDIPIFSALLNSDSRAVEGVNPATLESELLGDTPITVDDHKLILDTFNKRVQEIEGRTGMRVSGSSSETLPRKSGMDAFNSHTPSRPPLPTSSFNTAPPRVSSFGTAPLSGFGAIRPTGGADNDSSDSDESDSTDASSGSGSSRSSRSSSSSSSSRSSRDGQGRKGHGHKKLSDAIHRMNGGPLSDDIGPRDKMTMEAMILDIDTYRLFLLDNNIDLSNVREVDPQTTSYSEVKRIHNLLSVLYASRHYSTLFEELVLTTTSVLENIFDGSLKVFGKYPISYQGLTKNMSNRFRNNGRALSTAATKVATQIGIGPETIVIMELLLPFVAIPVKNMGDSKGPITNSDTTSAIGRLQ